MDEQARRASEVTPDLLRISVGLEDPEDLLSDLHQAIAGARHHAGRDTQGT
jgi:cystathionine beta-lyase/cystathionine gamma-synthase